MNMLGAFYVSDFDSGEAKDDPNYVQWKARLCDSENGIPDNKVCETIYVHRCSPDELESLLYDPTENSAVNQ